VKITIFMNSLHLPCTCNFQSWLHSFFFFVRLGFECRGFFCKASAPPLEAHFQFILLWLFWRRALLNYVLETEIFPNSVFQVGKITGMSHWCPTEVDYFFRPSSWEYKIIRKEESVYYLCLRQLLKTLHTLGFLFHFIVVAKTVSVNGLELDHKNQVLSLNYISCID
jgi:hypothetical protein